MRVPSGQARTASVIWLALWRVHRTAVVGAVRHAGAGPEEAQVVVDLGDGADGGARVVAGGLLLDRDGGREALDGVHVGLLHQPEELPGVGRQRLDVAPLPLGVDRVEGERRLARAGEPGDDRERGSGGCVTEMFLRLCSRAPRTTRNSSAIAMEDTPERLRDSTVPLGAGRPAVPFSAAPRHFSSFRGSCDPFPLPRFPALNAPFETQQNQWSPAGPGRPLRPRQHSRAIRRPGRRTPASRCARSRRKSRRPPAWTRTPRHRRPPPSASCAWPASRRAGAAVPKRRSSSGSSWNSSRVT